MEEKQKFAKYVTSSRRNLGMGKSEFSSALGISRSTLYRWESAKYMPRADAKQYWLNQIRRIEFGRS